MSSIFSILIPQKLNLFKGKCKTEGLLLDIFSTQSKTTVSLKVLQDFTQYSKVSKFYVSILLIKTHLEKIWKIENLPNLYFFTLVRWKITPQSFFNSHLSKGFLLTQAKFWRSMLGFAVLILWSLSYVILQICEVATMASLLYDMK